MSRELTAITVLIALFLGVATRSLNMNVRGFVAAFAVDIPVAGMTNKEVIAGFPGNFSGSAGSHFLIWSRPDERKL